MLFNVWLFPFLLCREVQYIVLQNIATMSIQRKVSLLEDFRTILLSWLIDAVCLIVRMISKQGMFEPYMKSFYVRSTDATHIKTLKVTTSLSFALRHIVTQYGLKWGPIRYWDWGNDVQKWFHTLWLFITHYNAIQISAGDIQVCNV